MNVIVTGASKGIGYQIVQALAKEGVSKIIGISRNYKQLCQLKEVCHQTANIEFIPISYDLQQITVVEPQLAGLIKQHVNQIDILINNAGILINRSFEQISADEVQRLFAVNYSAPALLIKNLLPLLKLGKAHVVNITSMGGMQGSVKFSGLAHYSASKAALAVLTECLAEEYKSDGVIFNALALGSVQTEMLTEAFPDYQAPVTPEQMGTFIANFALNGKAFFNGKILPVSVTTP